MHFLGVGKKTPSETSRLAECVGDTRSLLWKILADSHRNLAACRQQTPGNNKYHVPDELSKFQVYVIFRDGSDNNIIIKIFSNMRFCLEFEKCYNVSIILQILAERILEECHHTFVSCFHAFYPTGPLKWMCLCDLLSFEPVSISELSFVSI